MSPFLLKYVPAALRAVKIIIIITPHVVAICRQIQQQKEPTLFKKPYLRKPK